MDRASAMRKARESRGLTQKALAERSGISNRMICQLECGARNGTIVTIEILADALGMSIDEYIGHEVLVWSM